MKLLDRYILRLFLLNFVILFVVITGLILLLDLILNFDEFVQAAQRLESDGWAQAWQVVLTVVDFYGPRVLLFYVYFAGLLPLGAAGFTLAQLLRHRELTAMLASGISMHRIAMPILVLGFGANLLLIANQEFVLPGMAPKLARSQSDVGRGELYYRIHFMPAADGALYTAAKYIADTQTMQNLTVLRREKIDGEEYFGRSFQRITADSAVWDPRNNGWRLENGAVHYIEGGEPGSGRFAVQRTEPIAFMASDLDPLTISLREEAAFSNLLSMRQISDLMQRGELFDEAKLRLILHSRFSLVVLNMLILAMCLPYFLQRVPGNLLVPALKATALGVGAWAGGFIMLQIPIGALPPAAVAWLPVAMYLPVAYYMMDSVET